MSEAIVPAPPPTDDSREPERGTRRRKRKSRKAKRAADFRPPRFEDLLSGLPALFVAAIAIAMLLWPRVGFSLTEAYKNKARDRVEKGELRASVVCYKRLLAMEANRDLSPWKWELARVYTMLGDLSRAESLVRSLAPEDRPGMVVAELWLAKKLLGGRAATPEETRSAEIHLLRVLETAPNLDEAKLLLGILYANSGRPRAARPLLEATASKTKPDLMLKLSQVCKEIGDLEAARRAGEDALQALQVYTDQFPTHKEARLLLATAYAELDNYPGALSVLEGASTLLGEESWRRSMAAIYAAWAESLKKQGSDKDAERFNVVEKGLNYDAENSQLLGQLTQILSDSQADPEKVRARLRSMLVAGKSLAVAHFALGSDAWQNGRVEEARRHWEQACRVDASKPNLANILVANNLAWLLAYKEPTDLPRALELIDQALVSSPTHPILRGTRGQILSKLKRAKDAVSDLETAIAGGQDSAAIHSALADAYEQLGMADMAAAHRKGAR